MGIEDDIPCLTRIFFFGGGGGGRSIKNSKDLDFFRKEDDQIMECNYMDITYVILKLVG